MRNKTIKYHVIISIIWLVSFNSVAAMDIYDISKNKKPEVSKKEYFYRLNILESNYNSITVEMITDKIFLNNTRLLDNNEYKTLYLQGAGQYKNVGDPNLPTIYRFVALPQKAEYKLEILSKDSLLLDCDLQRRERRHDI
jgi:hypothetical protein